MDNKISSGERSEDKTDWYDFTGINDSLIDYRDLDFYSADQKHRPISQLTNQSIPKYRIVITKLPYRHQNRLLGIGVGVIFRVGVGVIFFVGVAVGVFVGVTVVFSVGVTVGINVEVGISVEVGINVGVGASCNVIELPTDDNANIVVSNAVITLAPPNDNVAT